ncbi:MAG: Eco57I restriction-modification methylase domain-containing protein [Candidatus Hodarchaeota archaeon]
MEGSVVKKLLNNIEKRIERFENEKFLEKDKSRNLGIIYTPNQVVDYIVTKIFRIYFEKFVSFNKEIKNGSDLEEVIHTLIKNLKTKENLIKIIKNIRILDPSCGSGRFLVSIAEKLYYIYRMLEPKLSDFDIKKLIIEKNLYGIEIEKSGILISKLRLIKWLLITDNNNFTFQNDNFKNIKITNFNQIIELLNLSFNLFNLDFLLEFNSDKFDIIIGNPPYVENKKIKPIEFKNNLTKRYKTAYRLFDLSILFIERALELLESNGYLSFILPNKFLSADYGIKIRELILNKSEIKEIINISSISIFQNVATYPIILSLKKVKQKKEHEVNVKAFNNLNELNENNSIKIIKFNQNLINIFPSKVIPISGNINIISYLFRNFKTLSETFKDLKIIYRPFGFLKYGKYFDNISDEPQSDLDLLLIGTGNVDKYYLKFNKRIKIAKRDLEICYFNYNPTFNPIWQDLKNEKIIFREIAKELTCVYDPGIFANITGLYLMRIPSINTQQLYCLLALLNSTLLDTVFKTLFSSLHMAGGYLRFNGSFIRRLPIPKNLPLSLSNCGKIIQILSQLHYDLSSKFIYRTLDLKFLNQKYQLELKRLLRFFIKLCNSLVKLIYLDELYLESNIDFSFIREFLYSKIELKNIQFKYLIPRYKIDNYETYLIEELEPTLDEIKNIFNIIYKNEPLLDQINQIYIKDVS